MPAPTSPLRLPSNQPPARFYRGGARISAFRGEPDAAPFTPEDWVGSTTTIRGEPLTGLTRLPSGDLLRDELAADPSGWLGRAHVDRYGTDGMLLVKLLDAGQRLPVHAHPDGAFAEAHLGAAHGKAEAWYILRGGSVHVGLREPVAPERLRQLVDSQDTAGMLALLNEVQVGPHDTVYVPPGTLHAIGEGVLLAEVQEPEDLSILLEWAGFELDGTAAGHLDLGFDLALQAVTTSALSAADLGMIVTRGIERGPVLSPASLRYFRLNRVGDGDVLPTGFAVVIGLDGQLLLITDTGGTPIPAGSTTLVPAAAGAMSFAGVGSALVARPPL